MAKAPPKKPKAPDPTEIEVPYLLHELPTAQHKAGLAGLLLQIDSMNERKAAGQLPPTVMVPEVVARSAAGATVRFTAPSVQDLFDDLYMATVEEAKSATRWPGAEIKREEIDPAAKPGDPKRKFVYDVVEPTGPFLRRYLDDSKESWHKLWRNMLWQVTRGRPTTRTPFNTRAKGEPTKEGGETWAELLKEDRARPAGKHRMVEVAGAIMLGAQAINAELVGFEDRADHALLLHFWMLTVRVFVPEVIDTEGRRKAVGFVLAMPDVADLVAFNRAYVRLLGELRPEVRGYRPAGAMISLPEQGPLEFMSNLDRIAARVAVEERPAKNLAGIEFFHMLPAGNNVKLMAHGRIPPVDRLLTMYSGIRDSCSNPLLLSCRLLAGLRGEPWYSQLVDPLAERPWWYFVHATPERTRTPFDMAGFAHEIQDRFEMIRTNVIKREEADLADIHPGPEIVDRLIYEMVGTYVKNLARRKKYGSPDVEGPAGDTAEERRDVCSKLFLELRSRNDDDFVRHFTATLGSVHQWLRDDDYLAVSAALMRPFTDATGEDRPRTREDVKTLTLLALSAHSRSLKRRDDAPANAPASTDQESSS